MNLQLDDVVKKSILKHCKSRGYSDKLTKLMVNLTRKYRSSGHMDDADLANYISRIQKELKPTKKGD